MIFRGGATDALRRNALRLAQGFQIVGCFRRVIKVFVANQLAAIERELDKDPAGR